MVQAVAALAEDVTVLVPRVLEPRGHQLVRERPVAEDDVEVALPALQEHPEGLPGRRPD